MVVATTETAMETPAISKLTDDAIRNEIAKLARMIAKRQEDAAELGHEICELQSKRDALLDVQIARLRAQKTVIEGE